MRITQRAAAAVLIVLVAFAACTSSRPKAKTSPSPSSVSLTGLTAKQIMDAALDAARAQSSFRLVSTSKFQGQTATFVNDVATERGKQEITIGSQHAEIVVVDNVAYLRANRAALLNFLGFPASIAAKMADRWVSFASSDHGFAQIAESVTLDSALTDVALSGPLGKTKEKTVAGQRVVGITGTSIGKTKATLYIGTAGNHLPVRENSAGKGGSTTVVFSRWRESVEVTAPPNALPFADVSGSPSSGTPA